jgi:ribosomal protein S18 acetylase RimI-like enzyme
MLELVYITEEGELLDELRQLFREYEKELDENLCFQLFEEEIKDPLIKYGPPTGEIILALFNEEIAGCIALSPMKEEGACEMKRLYVRPAYRQHRIGDLLVRQLIEEAITLGYSKMKLDTLAKLEPAIKLYLKYGFAETTAYYDNPLAGVVYMEKMLV